MYHFDQSMEIRILVVLSSISFLFMPFILALVILFERACSSLSVSYVEMILAALSIVMPSQTPSEPRRIYATGCSILWTDTCGVHSRPTVAAERSPMALVTTIPG